MRERRSEDEERWFDEAFEACWLSTFRFALAWTHDWQAAEDLAQDAFARLWAKRNAIDGSKPMLPWLLQVTRRLATDRFRRLRRVIRLTDGSQSGLLDADARLRWLHHRARRRPTDPHVARPERAGLSASRRSVADPKHIALPAFNTAVDAITNATVGTWHVAEASSCPDR